MNGNLKLGKHEDFKSIGEDCVVWFENQTLEIEIYMKHFFENEIKLKLYNCKQKNSRHLYEKNFESEDKN